MELQGVLLGLLKAGAQLVCVTQQAGVTGTALLHLCWTPEPPQVTPALLLTPRTGRSLINPAGQGVLEQMRSSSRQPGEGWV